MTNGSLQNDLLDYAGLSLTRQIQHQHTGISFRFDHGQSLELLGPRYDERTLRAVERGARSVLNQWPKGSIAW